VPEDLLDVAQVCLDRCGPVVARKQHFAMRNRDRFLIDIHHAARRIGSLGDLMHVAHGRDTRADVEKLADSGVDHEENGSAQEGPSNPDGVPYPRQDLLNLVRHDAVGREVVRAIQEIVVHPSRIGHGRVDALRHPVLVPSYRFPAIQGRHGGSLGDYGVAGHRCTAWS
jgi:hypothetical protein